MYCAEKLRLISIFASVFAALGIVTSATAQTYPSVLSPPVASEVDSNGVDLVTGQMNISTLDLAIGGQGSGIARIGSGFSMPYGDNFFGVINDDGAGNLTVSLGTSSETFSLASGVYKPSDGAPVTLTCSATDCLYTLADGAVADYSRSLTSAYGIVADYATLASITRPDGEVLTLTYRTTSYASSTVRYLNSVVSSLGWMLKYHVADDSGSNYVPVKIEAINTSVNYCDPTALACSGETVTWPYVLISSTGPTDQLGHHTTYNGGMAMPTSIVSPRGVTKTIKYNPSGSFANWVNEIDIGSSVWLYTYSLSGSVQTTTTVQQSGAGWRQLTIDTTTSQILTDTDAMGRTTKYAYYTTTGSGAYKGAVKQIINPDATYSGTTLTGGYTLYTYDDRGNVLSASAYPKGGGTALTTSATYSASPCANAKTCNKPLTVTDAAGVTTTYTYDANSGNIASMTLPAVGVAPQVRYTYAQQTPYVKNSSGGLSASTPVWRLIKASSCLTTSSCSGGADESTELIAYGNNNIQPTSVTIARGDANLSIAASASNEYRTTTLSYDVYGHVASLDGPIPGGDDTSYYFYDVLGRQTGLIGPDPDGSGSLPRMGRITAYNDDGQVSSVATGSVLGTTLTALNAMTVRDTTTTDYELATGLPSISRFYPGGSSSPQNVTQVSYDSLLSVDCVAERLNPSAFGSLPASACTQGTAGTDGPDRIVKYNYNADEQLMLQISGYGVTPRIDVSNIYNSNGTLASSADDKGNLTSYGYDVFNRPVTVCYPNPTTPLSSSTTDCEQVAYSGAQVSTNTLRNGSSISYGYDALGRVSSLSGAVSESYAYNNASQVTSHTANGVTETFTYDALNGLLSDAQPAGTVSYVYDAYGRRAQLTYPSYGGHAFSVGYGYDNAGDVVSETTAYNGGSAVQRAAFTADSFGRLSALSLGPGSQVTAGVGYDAASRLTSLSGNLAGSGNNASWGFSYTAANQLKARTQGGSGSYNYAPPADVTTSFTLNGLNQVTAANSSSFSYNNLGDLTSDGSVSYGYNNYNMLTSVGSASLSYDASNRLAAITSSGVTTKFLYDGADLIAEYDGSGVLLRRYVHGRGVDNPLVWFEGTDDATPRYLTSDQLGSITAVTDASGNALSLNSYNEYGLPHATNAAYQGRFGYTGQVYLPEIGLYNYKNRMYAPSLGRFLQPDPIGYGDGLNVYAYVHGDPVNYTDPWGTQSMPVCGEGCNNPATTVMAGGCPEGWTCYRNLQLFSNGPFYIAPLQQLQMGGGAPSQPSLSNLPTFTKCTGLAYVMKGNDDFLSKQTKGAWGDIITPMSAAIVPRQWTGYDRWNEGGGIKDFSASTFGTVTSKDRVISYNFSGLTDVVNNHQVGETVYNNSLAAQDAIMARAPGQLILEIVGGRDLSKNAQVELYTQNPNGCPTGTKKN